MPNSATVMSTACWLKYSTKVSRGDYGSTPPQPAPDRHSFNGLQVMLNSSKKKRDTGICICPTAMQFSKAFSEK